MDFTPDVIKHLEFIQNIITRMNTNSFQIKGLAITIVSAMLAIYASSPKVLFIFFAIFPTTLFWCLDAYYLQQERKFRGLYNDIAVEKKEQSVRLFEMPIKKYTGKGYTYFEVLFSETLCWLYIPIMVIVISIGLAVSVC